MRTFYEQWSALDSNLAVQTAEIGEDNILAVATAKIDSEKDPMAFSAAELPLAAFFSIGFTHHIAILAKAKTLEERKYYIQLCYDQHLKVEEIEQKIAEDAFHKQGTLPNNFSQTISDYKHGRGCGLSSWPVYCRPAFAGLLQLWRNIFFTLNHARGSFLIAASVSFFVQQRVGMICILVCDGNYTLPPVTTDIVLGRYRRIRKNKDVTAQQWKAMKQK